MASVQTMSRWWAAWTLAVAWGCGAASPKNAEAPSSSEVAAAEQELQALAASAGDLVTGSSSAPVQVVVLSDLRAGSVPLLELLSRLRDEYTKEQLQVVWKPVRDEPLPALDEADDDAPHVADESRWPLLLAARELKGDAGFESLLSEVATAKRARGGQLLKRAARAGFDATELAEAMAGETVGSILRRSHAQWRALGQPSLPSLYVNGVLLEGVPQWASLASLIDAQHAAASREGEASAAQTSRNLQAGFARRRSELQRRLDEQLCVPFGAHVAGVAGGADAAPAATPWVLEVVGSLDNGTIEALQQARELAKRRSEPIEVRWADAIGPSVGEAVEGASRLVRAATAANGLEGQWRAIDALYSLPFDASGADVAALAPRLGLTPAALAQAELTPELRRERLRRDELRDGMLPSVELNGLRLNGAAAPRASLAQQVPQALRCLEVGGRAIASEHEPEPPRRVLMPAPLGTAPSWGTEGAPITIEVISDFECPFCARGEQMLTEVSRAYPGQLRFVARDLPLAFHKNAMPAAETAREIWSQRGRAAYDAARTALFARARELDAATLREVAKDAGLDMARYDRAIKSGTHRAAIEHDIQAARTIGANGTPAFVVQGQMLSGAQPGPRLARLIERALIERAAAAR